MEKPGWIIIGAAFALFVCVLVGLAIGMAGGSAVEDVLAAADPGASATQSSTNVCVGLFNVGACRSQQASTTTTVRATNGQSPPSPWLVIVGVSAILLAAVGAALFMFKPAEL